MHFCVYILFGICDRDLIYDMLKQKKGAKMLLEKN